MNRRAAMFASVLGLVALLAGVSLYADEETIPLDKVPKPVSESVKKRFPNGEMKEAAKETEDGKTYYEVTVKDGGKMIDVTLTPDGAIITIEKELAVKDLPKAVTDGLEKKYPKATHKSAEEVIKVADGKEKLEYYEVVVLTEDKKTLEVEITADGTIKKEERK